MKSKSFTEGIVLAATILSRRGSNALALDLLVESGKTWKDIVKAGESYDLKPLRAAIKDADDDTRKALRCDEE